MQQRPFEPTNSWCYHFARYTAIPEILETDEGASGLPFRLIDKSRWVLDRHLNAAQQSKTFLRARTGEPMTVAAAVKFYIPFIAINTDQLERVGGGLFKKPRENIDELQGEAIDSVTEEDSDEPVDLHGWIYAFTFPLIKKAGGSFPIKIGKTANDVDQRIAVQCRQSAAFEHPEILGRWKVRHVSAAEQAIHSILKLRGKWRSNAPGTEWFDVTVVEIEEIIRFAAGRASTA